MDEFQLVEERELFVIIDNVLRGKQGERGSRGERGNGIAKIAFNDDSTMTITDVDGNEWTSASLLGKTGNGIARIEKTDTSGIIDTYTVYFTDGTTWTYQVANSAESSIDRIIYREEDPHPAGYAGNAINDLQLTVGLIITWITNAEADWEERISVVELFSKTTEEKISSLESALSDKLDTSAYVNFTGATAQNGGESGKVPAPAAGGERYLSSSGAWQAPDTTPTSGSDKLITSGAVYNAVAKVLANFTGVYSASAAYAVGSYCVYEGTLYRCVTAITTAEAWTAAHWTATTVGAELLALSAAIAANTGAENITFDSSAASHTAGSVAAAIANLYSLVSTAQTNITKLTKRTDMVSGTVTLKNTLAFPFNNSQVTVPISAERENQNYIVDYEVTAAVGNVGDIIVSAKLVNGFKLEYTGSASSVTVKYQVLGGMA